MPCAVPASPLDVALQTPFPAMREQSVFEVHPTQVPFSHTGALAELQSLDVRHCTHCFAVASHMGVDPPHAGVHADEPLSCDSACAQLALTWQSLARLEQPTGPSSAKSRAHRMKRKDGVEVIGDYKHLD